MLVLFDVSCFERELQVVFPDDCEKYRKEIENILEEAYDEWHSVEEIYDPEERAYVEDSCCEEHMIFRLSRKFNQWEKWCSEYYGNDPEDMEDEVFWTENRKEN